MRWSLTLVSALVGVLVAAPLAGLSWVGPAPLAAGDVRFAGYERVVHLDAYRDPVTAVGYADGAGASVQVPLTHAGDGGPVTIVAVDPFPELLGMLEVEAVSGLPVTLAAGQTTTIGVRARFANCRYYTERAVNLFRGAEVTVDGPGGPRSQLVAYPSEIVLRSPTILGCSDRSLDRSARQRLLARDE